MVNELMMIGGWNMGERQIYDVEQWIDCGWIMDKIWMVYL
jgi:hypothetical protein